MPKYKIDYSKSIIYKIEHLENPELLYVGSSTNFVKRKQDHKFCCNSENNSKYNMKVYKMIRENGGWDQFKIIVIKEYPCDSKINLLMEEDRMMKELKATLNRQRAYVSDEEEKIIKKEIDKKYYQDHKEQITLYNKKHYQDHKEQYKETNKQYRKENIEQLKQYYQDNNEKAKQQAKQYYENKKDEINTKRLMIIKCECGCEITYCSKARHQKSRKHLKYLEQKP